MAKLTLLEELLDGESKVPKPNIIEEQANHVITSAVNLMALIEESFSKEESDDLQKRLVLSIKNKDPQRFSRSIKKLKESHNEKKNK